METIDHPLKNGRSLKATKRKLGIGKNPMYAIRDKEDNVTANMDKIVQVAEDFYRDIYSSLDNQDDNGISPKEFDMPPVTPEEVNKALGAIQRNKAVGVDQVTDLLKDGGQIVLEKLSTLHTQCFMTSSVPVSWKNANIILILKKEDVKDMKNYRPI